MDERRFYVYSMRATDRLMPFYIGKGTGRRWRDHLKPSRRELDHAKNDQIDEIQARGEEVCVQKLAISLTQNQAWELEKFIIDEIGLANLSNRIAGGQGTAHTRETREKISEAMDGHDVSKQTRDRLSEVNSGEGAYFYNREFTDEHRQNISQANSLETHPQTELSREEVAHIRWLAQESELYQREIAELYGTTQRNIGCIEREESWKGIAPKRPTDVDIQEIVRSRSATADMKSSLTTEDVQEIKWLLQNTDLKQSEIAARYGVVASSISEINTGATWGEVSKTQKP
jgi:predicted XRE-type DNA-binding protein